MSNDNGGRGKHFSDIADEQEDTLNRLDQLKTDGGRGNEGRDDSGDFDSSQLRGKGPREHRSPDKPGSQGSPQEETNVEVEQEVRGEEIVEDATESSSGLVSGAVSRAAGRVSDAMRKPVDVINSKRDNGSDVESWEELSGSLGDFSHEVERLDETRADLEADVQATVRAYEDEIADYSETVAQMLKDAKVMANEELEFNYEFEPNRGSFSLNFDAEGLGDTFEGQEVDVTGQYDLEIEDEGLANFLNKASAVGDLAARKHRSVQQDMVDLADRREDLKDELSSLRNRNEDQLEGARSDFSTEEEREDAEVIKEAEDERDEEYINSQLEEVNRRIGAKRPRKEQHQQVRDSVLTEVKDVYDEHATEVEGFVHDVSERVEDMVDALDALTSVELGEMNEMVRERLDQFDVDFDPNGKYLEDGEGDLREFHQDVVQQVGRQAALQYAQGIKAIEELGYFEDIVEDNLSADRMDLDESENLRVMLNDAYDSDEEFEEYLGTRMDSVLGDYSARDSIRQVFAGLENLRDQAELSE